MNKKYLSIVMAVTTLVIINSTAKASLKPTDDWSTIQTAVAQAQAYIYQPRSARVFGTAGLFNACVEGNRFRSLKPQIVCLQSVTVNDGNGQEGPGNTVKCVEQVQQYIYIPMMETRIECVESAYVGLGQEGAGGAGDTTCVEQKTVSTVLAAKQTFAVYKTVYGHQNVTAKFLFNKDYVVPNCK